MRSIPVKIITHEDGSITNTPSLPIQAGASAVLCDGENYIIYEADDALPDILINALNQEM